MKDQSVTQSPNHPREVRNVSHAERAFRCLKGMDVRVRPIRHRTEDHVRAHIFLCMLAYYVEWHMRKDLAPLLFQDEELDHNRRTRDPMAPAKASASAKRKKRTRLTPDGPTFKQVTEFTPLQAKAMQLLGLTQ